MKFLYFYLLLIIVGFLSLQIQNLKIQDHSYLMEDSSDNEEDNSKGENQTSSPEDLLEQIAFKDQCEQVECDHPVWYKKLSESRIGDKTIKDGEHMELVGLGINGYLGIKDDFIYLSPKENIPFGDCPLNTVKGNFFKLRINCAKAEFFCDFEEYIQQQSNILAPKYLAGLNEARDRFSEEGGLGKCFILEFEDNIIHYVDSYLVCTRIDSGLKEQLHEYEDRVKSDVYEGFEEDFIHSGSDNEDNNTNQKQSVSKGYGISDTSESESQKQSDEESVEEEKPDSSKNDDNQDEQSKKQKDNQVKGFKTGKKENEKSDVKQNSDQVQFNNTRFKEPVPPLQQQDEEDTEIYKLQKLIYETYQQHLIDFSDSELDQIPLIGQFAHFDVKMENERQRLVSQIGLNDKGVIGGYNQNNVLVSYDEIDIDQEGQCMIYITPKRTISFDAMQKKCCVEFIAKHQSHIICVNEQQNCAFKKIKIYKKLKHQCSEHCLHSSDSEVENKNELDSLKGNNVESLPEIFDWRIEQFEEEYAKPVMDQMEIDYQLDIQNGNWQGWVWFMELLKNSQYVPVRRFMTINSIEQGAISLFKKKEDQFPEFHIQTVWLKFDCDLKNELCTPNEYQKVMEEANIDNAQDLENEKSSENIMEALDNQYDLTEEIKDFFTKIDYDQEKQDKWCSIVAYEIPTTKVMGRTIICNLHEDQNIFLNKAIQQSHMDGFRNQRLGNVDSIDDDEEFEAFVFRDGKLVSENIRLSAKAMEDVTNNTALWVYSQIQGNNHGKRCELKQNTFTIPPIYQNQINPVCCLEFYSFGGEKAVVCSAKKVRCYVEIKKIARKLIHECLSQDNQNYYVKQYTETGTSDSALILQPEKDVEELVVKSVPEQGIWKGIVQLHAVTKTKTFSSKATITIEDNVIQVLAPNTTLPMYLPFVFQNIDCVQNDMICTVSQYIENSKNKTAIKWQNLQPLSKALISEFDNLDKEHCIVFQQFETNYDEQIMLCPKQKKEIANLQKAFLRQQEISLMNSPMSQFMIAFDEQVFNILVECPALDKYGNLHRRGQEEVSETESPTEEDHTPTESEETPESESETETDGINDQVNKRLEIMEKSSKLIEKKLNQQSQTCQEGDSEKAKDLEYKMGDILESTNCLEDQISQVKERTSNKSNEIENIHDSDDTETSDLETSQESSPTEIEDNQDISLRFLQTNTKTKKLVKFLFKKKLFLKEDEEDEENEKDEENEEDEENEKDDKNEENEEDEESEEDEEEEVGEEEYGEEEEEENEEEEEIKMEGALVVNNVNVAMKKHSDDGEEEEETEENDETSSSEELVNNIGLVHQMQLQFKPDGVYRTDGSIFFYYDELSDDINNKCPISYSSTIVPEEISGNHPEVQSKCCFQFSLQNVRAFACVLGPQCLIQNREFKKTIKESCIAGNYTHSVVIPDDPRYQSEKEMDQANFVLPGESRQGIEARLNDSSSSDEDDDDNESEDESDSQGEEEEEEEKKPCAPLKTKQEIEDEQCEAKKKAKREKEKKEKEVDKLKQALEQKQKSCGSE